MKDLKSQLAAAFGVPEPPDTDKPLLPPEPPRPEEDPILAEGAWRDTPWSRRLEELLPSLTGAPKLAARPSLGNLQQVTDQALKRLKAAGRRREATELKGLRSDFMGKRDKAAWSAIKARFSELSLSEKAYRRLKQEAKDPVRILERLLVTDPGTLSALGAARLVEHLT